LTNDIAVFIAGRGSKIKDGAILDKRAKQKIIAQKLALNLGLRVMNFFLTVSLNQSTLC